MSTRVQSSSGVVATSELKEINAILKDKKAIELNNQNKNNRINEIKNRIEELTFNIKVLSNTVKQYEESTGFEGICAWISDKVSSIFGLGNIEGFKNQIQMHKIEIETLKQELAELENSTLMA